MIHMWAKPLTAGLALAAIASAITIVGCTWEAGDDPNNTTTAKPRVTILTSMGTIVVELEPDFAPISCNNFLRYVQEGFYDGTDGGDPTIIHRVAVESTYTVVQGGGLTEATEPKDAHDPIAHETNNGLSNIRGTVGMARTTVLNSATSEFYFNVTDNSEFFNYAEDEAGIYYGYVVFAHVVEGMDVLDAMAAVPTDIYDLPLTTIVIQAVTEE